MVRDSPEVLDKARRQVLFTAELWSEMVGRASVSVIKLLGNGKGSVPNPRMKLGFTALDCFEGLTHPDRASYERHFVDDAGTPTPPLAVLNLSDTALLALVELPPTRRERKSGATMSHMRYVSLRYDGYHPYSVASRISRARYDPLGPIPNVQSHGASRALMLDQEMFELMSGFPHPGLSSRHSLVGPTQFPEGKAWVVEYLGSNGGMKVAVQRDTATNGLLDPSIKLPEAWYAAAGRMT